MPHRWRDPGPEHTKRRIEARYNGRRNGPSADANSLWSESDSELNDDDANGGGGSRGGDDSESVLSYSTLASTVRTGANPFDDSHDDSYDEGDADAVHGGAALAGAAAGVREGGGSQREHRGGVGEHLLGGANWR